MKTSVTIKFLRILDVVKLVSKICRYGYPINIGDGVVVVNAKSLRDVVSLGLNKELKVIIHSKSKNGSEYLDVLLEIEEYAI